MRALAVVGFAALCACSHMGGNVGSNAARGAIAQTRTEIEASGGALTATLAGATVRGAIDSLSEPQQQSQLVEVMIAASDAAARGFSAGLRSEVPAFEQLAAETTDRLATLASARFVRAVEGSGLGAALTRLSVEVSKGAVVNLCEQMGQIFPDCVDMSCGRCMEMHLTAVTRATVRGMASEMANAVRVPVLVLAFLAGAVLALLLATARRVRRSAPTAVP